MPNELLSDEEFASLQLDADRRANMASSMWRNCTVRATTMQRIFAELRTLRAQRLTPAATAAVEAWRALHPAQQNEALAVMHEASVRIGGHNMADAFNVLRELAAPPAETPAAHTWTLCTDGCAGIKCPCRCHVRPLHRCDRCAAALGCPICEMSRFDAEPPPPAPAPKPRRLQGLADKLRAEAAAHDGSHIYGLALQAAVTIEQLVMDTGTICPCPHCFECTHAEPTTCVNAEPAVPLPDEVAEVLPADCVAVRREALVSVAYSLQRWRAGLCSKEELARTWDDLEPHLFAALDARAGEGGGVGVL